jgi:hypothetical protein
MNKKKDTEDALKELELSSNGKSNTSQIMLIIDSIESALSSGVKRNEILKTVNSHFNISMNMATFENTLYRIRKKRKELNVNNVGSNESSNQSKNKPDETGSNEELKGKKKHIAKGYNTRQILRDIREEHRLSHEDDSE